MVRVKRQYVLVTSTLESQRKNADCTQTHPDTDIACFVHAPKQLLEHHIPSISPFRIVPYLIPWHITRLLDTVSYNNSDTV